MGEQQDPPAPGRTFDWSAVCQRDLGKESARSANKRKLAEVAKMRSRMEEMKKKLSMELAVLENAEMKAKAERDRNFCTLKLLEVISKEPITKGEGAFFFLDVDGLVSETCKWRTPFVVPYQDELVLRLLDTDKATIGTMRIVVRDIQAEELENGTDLSLPFGHG